MSTTPPPTHSRTDPPSTSSNPPLMPPKKPLTLILAATPSLGIGRAGGLPWPPHKPDMSFFARVTKRVPAHLQTRKDRRYMNAVIMGRKTWESIPGKFRPLAGRVNVVISGAGRVDGIPDSMGRGADAKEGDVVLLARDLEAALRVLDSLESGSRGENIGSAGLPSSVSVARVFVIGGARVYKAALGLQWTDRVLLTRIGKEYQCDTFFPLDLEKEEGWVRRGKSELEEFTGEEVGEGREEKGVPFEFCLFERVKP